MHVGHRDKELLVLLTEVKNVDDVLVVQFLHGLGFEIKTLDRFDIRCGVENLEGDFAL